MGKTQATSTTHHKTIEEYAKKTVKPPTKVDVTDLQVTLELILLAICNLCTDMEKQACGVGFEVELLCHDIQKIVKRVTDVEQRIYTTDDTVHTLTAAYVARIKETVSHLDSIVEDVEGQSQRSSLSLVRILEGQKG
ncbi:hypothetical protein NDU88_004665 [Pleurodeles waltl]|uniref:Uncharacterized protein n=1 Tax=Pleurodeles waltl TaxID=8319 RepID=A0AAV7TSJ4_PLEWA|nr:hypothetical protein NDU88_004665 [Pleurodeles waltl]